MTETAAKGLREESLNRQVERLSLLHAAGKDLASSLDLDGLLAKLLQNIEDVLHPDTWSLLLVEPEFKRLRFEVAVGQGAEKLKGLTIPLGQGIAGWVAQKGESVLVEDARNDPRFLAAIDELTGIVTRSLLCVPVTGRHGILGVIELVNYGDHEAFRKDDLPFLQTLADYTAIALENARHVARISELTITDDCTRLYNARRLHEVLDMEVYRSGRYGFPFCLVFLDLDRFKAVNDTWGHLAGSKLLRRVGDLILENIRLIDQAFRYGGDEFVVLLPQTSREGGLIAVQRLRERLEEATLLAEEGITEKLTASFGLAIFPEDGTSREELLAKADAAMYLAKRSGRNAVASAGFGVVTPSHPPVHDS